jgi:hypothetical protein
MEALNFISLRSTGSIRQKKRILQALLEVHYLSIKLQQGNI